jgi:hypothetical protein
MEKERQFEYINISDVVPGMEIEVSYSPQSQKYFLLDLEEYERWFPTYSGVVISSNHTILDEIILQNPDTKETFACKNRAGDESMSFIRRLLV